MVEQRAYRGLELF